MDEDQASMSGAGLPGVKRDAVSKVYTESIMDAQARVDTALKVLHWHVNTCPDCRKAKT
jgi:hypothetical protein